VRTTPSGVGFIGTTKKAPLDLDEAAALPMLVSPTPSGRPNSDVIVPYLNARDVVSRLSNTWIIDFPPALDEQAASQYEAPFGYVEEHVRPLRQDHREESQRRYWWRQARPCPDMKAAIGKVRRFLLTPTLSKHRVFVWGSVPANPDHQLVVFARDDDYFFGVVHSRAHELWALHQGTRLETRPRYTPTSCFETFPFPSPTDAQREAIAAAAKELDALRSRWLNPPEWVKEDVLEFPASVDGPWARMVTNANSEGIGTARYVRLVPGDESAAAALKKRTLTNLYNNRPAWLANAHRVLDEAVFAAYGWPPSLSDDELLAKLLDLNLARASSEPTAH